MKKGKIKDEPINVIAFCGDGGADMGLAAISAALTDVEYNLLIFLYDNESYANTDIQTSGQTPWGGDDLQPSGQEAPHHAAPVEEERPRHARRGPPRHQVHSLGHPGHPRGHDGQGARGPERSPTYMHVLDPCPKGWHYDPEHSNELGKLAIETGIYPLYEIKEGVSSSPA